MCIRDRVKAVDSIIIDTGIKAENVPYTNEDHSELTNVREAIDYLLSHESGSTPSFSLSWDNIIDKPKIADNIALSEGVLEIKSGDSVLSSVNVTIDSDIDDIINNLK